MGDTTGGLRYRLTVGAICLGLIAFGLFVGAASGGDDVDASAGKADGSASGDTSASTETTVTDDDPGPAGQTTSTGEPDRTTVTVDGPDEDASPPASGGQEPGAPDGAVPDEVEPNEADTGDQDIGSLSTCGDLVDGGSEGGAVYEPKADGATNAPVVLVLDDKDREQLVNDAWCDRDDAVVVPRVVEALGEGPGLDPQVDPLLQTIERLAERSDGLIFVGNGYEATAMALILACELDDRDAFAADHVVVIDGLVDQSVDQVCPEDTNREWTLWFAAEGPPDGGSSDGWGTWRAGVEAKWLQSPFTLASILDLS